MKPYIAIDPGASGGIAVISESGLLTVHSMPDDLTELWDLPTTANYTVVIEDVPKFVFGGHNRGSTMAVLHYNYGWLMGHFQARGYPVVKVRPAEWQKTIGIGKKGTLSTSDWKGKLKQEASRRWPAVKCTLKNSDALLLLSHAMQANL